MRRIIGADIEEGVGLRSTKFDKTGADILKRIPFAEDRLRDELARIEQESTLDIPRKRPHHRYDVEDLETMEIRKRGLEQQLDTLALLTRNLDAKATYTLYLEDLRFLGF